MTCIEIGSEESHFNVSLIVRDKVTRVSTNHSFWRERRAEAVSNRGPYQITALPLGQTGSPLRSHLSNFLYSAVLVFWADSITALWSRLVIARFWISTEAVYLQRCLVVTWLVPRETAAVSAHVLCTPCNRTTIIQWWCWWLLLYSAILRSRADSLRSHVILHEWLDFIARLWISTEVAVYLQRWHGWCHMKLLPSRGKFCVHHTTMHHVTSCKATYIRCVRV